MVFGVSRRRPLRWAIPIGLFRLGREARHYDVLVSGSEIGYTFLLGGLIAKVLGKPYVVVVQSPVEAAITTWMPKPLQSPTRMLMGRVDAAICVADGLVSGVTDAGLDRDKVFVLPVGIDVERARLLETEPANVPTPTGRYVVAVGRLSEQKGFDLLIRAHASILHDTQRSYHLVIAGEGPERHLLEGLVNELGVDRFGLAAGFCRITRTPCWPMRICLSCLPGGKGWVAWYCLRLWRTERRSSRPIAQLVRVSYWTTVDLVNWFRQMMLRLWLQRCCAIGRSRRNCVGAHRVDRSKLGNSIRTTPRFNLPRSCSTLTGSDGPDADGSRDSASGRRLDEGTRAVARGS